MVLVILNGLTKKDIPYEGQIIRVADEYDAIVSKRQYKSHVGISDTLKILIQNTKSDALNEVSKNVKLGKNNPVIVKALLKVVIDDIGYEISCIQSYIQDLEKELKRFEQIKKYKEKMEHAKKDKDKNYYYEGIKLLLKNEETLENYETIQEEYKNAFATRKSIIDNLYKEIKSIKKFKI